MHCYYYVTNTDVILSRIGECQYYVSINDNLIEGDEYNMVSQNSGIPE